MGYVKFVRGSQNAFDNLREKKVDTLYFIKEPNTGIGKLYLGNLLIGSSDSILGLEDLRNIDLQNDTEEERYIEGFLVWDPNQEMWVKKSLEELVVSAEDPQREGRPGLVPPPISPTDVGKFLKSDGTWQLPFGDAERDALMDEVFTTMFDEYYSSVQEDENSNIKPAEFEMEETSDESNIDSAAFSIKKYLSDEIVLKYFINDLLQIDDSIQVEDGATIDIAVGQPKWGTIN